MVVPTLFEGMTIVDADTHYTEPHDLWTSRGTSTLKDRLPRVAEHNGQAAWVVDDGLYVSRAGASGVVAADGSKASGIDFFTWTFDDIHPGAHTVSARLAMMDELGVWAQIVYPNAFGFAGATMAKVTDDELRGAVASIYNDAMIEMQSESNDRLLPMATIPFWDIGAAVAEVDRIHRLGLRGVNMTTAPHEFGAPDLADPAWNRFWEACVERQLPVNFHIGAAVSDMDWYGSSSWPSLSPDHKLALGSAMLYLNNAKVLGNLIYGGVLERFPELHVVSVESAVGWLPFVLEAFRYQMGELGPAANAHLSLTPLEYFQRQIHACFWFETEGITEVIDRLGHQHLMFETDFPHPTCLHPDGLEWAARALGGITDPEVRADVVGRNAAKLYNIPLPDDSQRSQSMTEGTA